uniref:Carbonic anhydrase n=1 Tax=Sus scrofa TaxID=9823 RepID=A0A8D1F5W3_PIG
MSSLENVPLHLHLGWANLQPISTGGRGNVIRLRFTVCTIEEIKPIASEIHSSPQVTHGLDHSTPQIIHESLISSFISSSCLQSYSQKLPAVQISLPSTMRLTAPDGTQYIAKQMHFHWGGAFSEISGSEHTIDGIRYVTEVHVVHYNSKYKSYDEAQTAPDGLAVLAALFEIKDYAENTYYSDFISHLKNIRIPGQTTVLSNLNLQDMLPENLHSYYSYQGSLTTPPCTENVHWFVLADTVKLSRTQVWKLQNSLLNDQNKTIHNDYRRTQPLNHRVVEANFKSLPNPRSELHFYLNNIDNNLEYLRRVIEQKKAKGKGPW